MDFRYKPGDKVRVIGHIVKGQVYEMRSGPGADSKGTTVQWSYRHRKPYEGKVVTISGYFDDLYLVKEISGIPWVDEMFDGFAAGGVSFTSLL